MGVVNRLRRLFPARPTPEQLARQEAEIRTAMCLAFCRERIRRIYADLGFDMHVTTTPPLVGMDYVGRQVCQHGREWFAEATGEQVAKWCAEARR